jgi:hypothetical protein
MANATLMMLREHPRTTTTRGTDPRNAAHTTDPTPIGAAGTAAPTGQASASHRSPSTEPRADRHHTIADRLHPNPNRPPAPACDLEQSATASSLTA